jgi:hypothetical protein
MAIIVYWYLECQAPIAQPMRGQMPGSKNRFYWRCAEEYPEHLLRKILSEIRANGERICQSPTARDKSRPRQAVTPTG